MREIHQVILADEKTKKSLKMKMKGIQKIVTFIKKEPVLSAASFLAIISACFVRPGKEYITYIDWRVLGILLSLMLVMQGFQKVGVFQNLANALLLHVKNLRALLMVLVNLCFFTSMLITNDVALLTFVPFTILILKDIKREDKLILVIVLQTIAANLGSMLTPIGNPQNLYLYGLLNVELLDFIKILLPYTVVSFVLLTVFLILQPKEQIQISLPKQSKEKDKQNGKSGRCKIGIYGILFLLCLLCVIRVLPWQVVLLAVAVIVLCMDPELLKKADYMLLLTFVAFFIFIGNMGRIDFVRDSLQKLIDGRELFTGIAASQLISNVPAALLLSGFTTDYKTLLLSVDIGGLGTLIASMASLISYKMYANTEGSKKGYYFGYFTILNGVFLIVLVLTYVVLCLL